LNSEADFASLMGPVARAFWGDPTPSHSTKLSLRWGSNGSRSVDLQKGTWFDHESGLGGGVIDLVMQEAGADKPGALGWLEEGGFIEKRAQRAAPAEESAPEYPEEPENWYDSGDSKKVEFESYTYVNRDGEALYQVVRFQWRKPDGTWLIDPKTGTPKKTFAQRRKDHRGEIVWNLDGIGHTIYRHNKIEQAIADGKPIFLPEGEKDVRTFEQWELVGTTNSGGAKNWSPKLAAYLKGADVIIPIDNDDVGRAMGEAKAKSLKGIARRIRILDFAQLIPNFPNKHDVTDWKDAGGTKEQLLALVDRLPDWTPAPPPTGFGATQMHDLAGSKIVYDWLIKGLIERGGVFIVAGEKQAGKSFFIMDMGMKIARGIDYGGKPGLPGRKVRQGLVIYMACEDAKGVKMRAEGYCRDQGLKEGDVPFLIMDHGFTLMSDAVVDKFIAECLDWQEFYKIKLELIVIDTFSVATEGLDEISSKETGQVLSRVHRIAEKTGSAVCLVHHLNGEGKRVRGHSSLTANVSQVIEIRQMTEFQTNRNKPVELVKDSDKRIVRQALLEKNKNGPNQLKWRFVLRKVDLGLDEDGFEISTCVLDTPSSDVSDEPSKSKISGEQRMVLEALSTAQEVDGIDMPPGVRVGAQIKRAVNEKAFVAHVRKVWSFRAEEPEARNKELGDALKRIVTALVTAGYMGRDNDQGIVWHLWKDDRRREPAPVERPRPSPLMTAEDIKVPF
jgi:hypothetical protein